MSVHVFTSASFAYLDRARVLGETLRKHHPDWTFWLCLCDREPDGFVFDVSVEPIDRVVRAEMLDIPRFQSWAFEHSVVEFCTAVKGYMLCRLLDEPGATKVIYLDPDTALLSPLEEVDALLDRSSVVLTPHLLDPESNPASIADNEISSLKHGVYNLGFVAVSATSEGRRFAAWWRDRLRDYCFDDVPNGLFTDQRWCDHVPSFFDGVHILKHPGYNVASWNLSQRPITIGHDGVIRAKGEPLRFFHFTKVTWVGMQMLERYAGGRIEVFELIHWYKTMLEEAKVEGLPSGWWCFSQYDDGVPILPSHRLAYRMDASLATRFPDPFFAGPELRAVLDAYRT
jgi:hypothetical protein